MYARRCPAAPARRSREPPLRSPRSHAGALDRTFWPRWSSPSMGCTCPCIAKASATREGVPIEVSTLADWVGAVSVALQPLVEAIKAHVLASARIHADDTPVPVLAKGKTRTGRLWTVVRDDRPFGGTGPPAAAYFYSPDRRGEHAQAFLTGYAGVLQADAYSGFGQLYEPGRPAGAITEAACRVGGDVAIPAPHRPGRADLSGSSAIAGFRPHRSHRAALPQWALQDGPAAGPSSAP